EWAPDRRHPAQSPFGCRRRCRLRAPDHGEHRLGRSVHRLDLREPRPARRYPRRSERDLPARRRSTTGL
ncbi:MAG: hypothetical protein AVDCRST_MAG59-3826, partial [uncultured Thermomicrobiales bacterium]